MTRWQRSEAPRGDDYDARWRSLAAKGESIHGEADLVSALLDEAALPNSEANPSHAEAACSIGAEPAPENTLSELISGGNVMKLISDLICSCG